MVKASISKNDKHGYLVVNGLNSAGIKTCHVFKVLSDKLCIYHTMSR